MKMGLREANQQFSKAIQIVKSGRNVVLTERGKPIAVISPLPSLVSDDAGIEKLRSEGILLAAHESRPMGPFKPIRAKGRTGAEILRDERNER